MIISYSISHFILKNGQIIRINGQIIRIKSIFKSHTAIQNSIIFTKYFHRGYLFDIDGNLRDRKARINNFIIWRKQRMPDSHAWSQVFWVQIPHFSSYLYTIILTIGSLRVKKALCIPQGQSTQYLGKKLLHQVCILWTKIPCTFVLIFLKPFLLPRISSSYRKEEREEGRKEKKRGEGKGRRGKGRVELTGFSLGFDHEDLEELKRSAILRTALLEHQDT